MGGLAGRGRNWGRPSTGGQPIGLPIQRRTIDARRVHILRRLANDASGQFLTATVRAATAESVNRRNATTVGQLDIIITPSKGLLVADNKDSNVKQPSENPDGDHFNPGNMAGKGPGDTDQPTKNRGKPSHRDETPG